MLSLSNWRSQSERLSICKDKRHNTLLHKDKQRKPEGGASVESKCTSLCGASEGGVSCSKVVLVDVIGKERTENICRNYAIIDDQSNTSLITSELADELGATGPQEKYYLTTCSGEKEAKYGRRVTGVVLKSLDGSESELPTLIECNNIPRDKQEIPTPEIARRFPHLRLPTETSNYEFLPCPNQFKVKDSFVEKKQDLKDDVFISSREGNDVALSCEDRKFLAIMETGVHKNEQGNWEMPLPFHSKDPRLPNNRSQADNRLNGLIRTLKRKPQMAKDYRECNCN